MEYEGAVYHLVCRGERRAAEDSTAYQRLRRGWCLGDERFRKELLEEMAKGMGPEHYGEECRESEAEQAERAAKGKLRRAGWSN